MRLGFIEIFIGVGLVAGLTWVATTLWHAKHGEMCTGVALNPEVKAYIDTKLTSSGGACGDLPKLISRVGEMQLKLGNVEGFKQNLKSLYDMEMSYRTFLQTSEKAMLEVMENSRSVELRKLKTQITSACAVGAPPVEEGGESENSGFGARGGRGGGGGNRQQEAEVKVSEPLPSMPSARSAQPDKPGPPAAAAPATSSILNNLSAPSGTDGAETP